MSVDFLHDRIRKLKNPTVLDFDMKPEHIPKSILSEETSFLNAYQRYCTELMESLKNTIPAVRFSFNTFALEGPDGLYALKVLLETAGELGFYVLLDSPEILSPWGAERVAQTIFGKEAFPCDGLIISPYIGSDSVKPFVNYAKDGQKDVFLLVHTPNKSSFDLQDLLTGSRHVYDAVADIANRFGESLYGKCGYSYIGGVASATNGLQLQTLRAKHNRMFLIVDGVDYPSGNFKNCSMGFDRFGYGCVLCAGPSITAAWSEDPEHTYLESAIASAEKMKKNISRYVTIL